MPRLSCLLLSLMIASLVGFAANATTLVEVDDPVFGPGSITRDSDKGLDWLDVPISVGRSFNDVSAQFGPGGDFAGFRYATREEITDLFVSAGIDSISAPPTTESYLPALALIGLLGMTESGSDLESSYLRVLGATGTERNGGYRFGVDLVAIDVFAYGRTLGQAENYEIAIPDDATGSFGHWLVRPIPEPGTGVLVVGGLLGLGCWPRERA